MPQHLAPTAAHQDEQTGQPTGLQPGQPPVDAQVIYLEVGPNVWGKGFTRDQAHAAAGRPRFRVVFAITDPWSYIDGMGSITRIDSAPTPQAAAESTTTTSPDQDPQLDPLAQAVQAIQENPHLTKEEKAGIVLGAAMTAAADPAPRRKRF